MVKRALGVIDLEKDFAEGGSLAVRGGHKVAKDVAAYIKASGAEYDLIFASKDWHIDPGSHFSETPDFVDSWPPHCLAGTPGADFIPPITSDLFDYIVHKGQWSAAYSAFEGRTQHSHKLLEEILDYRKIDEVDFCGLALDYCVAASGIQSAQQGYKTRVLSELTAAVHNDRKSVAEVIKILREAGVDVV